LGKNPSPKARRNLILLSKLLQNLSNDVEFGVKEPHMAVVNEYIVANRDLMIEFLRKVASDPAAEEGISNVIERRPRSHPLATSFFVFLVYRDRGMGGL